MAIWSRVVILFSQLKLYLSDLSHIVEIVFSSFCLSQVDYDVLIIDSTTAGFEDGTTRPVNTPSLHSRSSVLLVIAKLLLPI